MSRGLDGHQAEAEYSKAQVVLRRPHAFTKRIAENRLKELFVALGAQVTVTFDHIQREIRPLNVPAAILLALGANGESILGATEALARARGNRTHKELPIGGRGDRI
jgi:hypothetical protein